MRFLGSVIYDVLIIHTYVGKFPGVSGCMTLQCHILVLLFLGVARMHGTDVFFKLVVAD